MRPAQESIHLSILSTSVLRLFVDELAPRLDCFGLLMRFSFGCTKPTLLLNASEASEDRLLQAFERASSTRECYPQAPQLRSTDGSVSSNGTASQANEADQLGSKRLSVGIAP